MGIAALQAAKCACAASGWSLTNLQLQKILYIAHMVYMGNHGGEPLITNDAFEAWKYGPVLPSVYHVVKGFGDRPIGNVFGAVAMPPDTEPVRFLRTSVEKLKDVAPFKLVQVLHDSRSAWKKNYVGSMWSSPVIPYRDIMSEFNERFPQHATIDASA